jgi:hypothetical protein
MAKLLVNGFWDGFPSEMLRDPVVSGAFREAEILRLSEIETFRFVSVVLWEDRNRLLEEFSIRGLTDVRETVR